MRAIRIALLFVLALCGGNSDVLACSCSGEAKSGREALPNYSAVFLGYVTNIRLLASDAPVLENEYRFDGQAEVTFRVRRAWKGVDRQVMSVVTATQVTACGYPFQVGQYYVVYANPDPENPVLGCSLCSPTKELSQARKEIVSLGPPTFQAEEPQSK